MKLNFGCGSNFLPAPWVNIDLSGPDEVVKMDITKLPLPYADNSVDFILAEHIVEHVPLASAVLFIEDCRRILKPGGTLRVIVPVLDKVKPDHARDLCMGHGHLTAWTPFLLAYVIRACGFKDDDIRCTDRRDGVDGHYLVIGKEKDDIESARIEATK